MAFLNLVILAALALAIMAIGTFFVLLIRNNMQNGRKFRRGLAERVQHQRMAKLLKPLGLDFDVYLHQVSVQKINESMSRCENCQTTDACDAKTQQKAVQFSEIDFCQNQASLTSFSEMIVKAA